MIKDRYDCLIIGGGIGGTVMASMLSLYGVDVLLVEKNHVLGGCVTDFKVNDFVCSHSIDWFSGLHEKGRLYYWFDKIGLLDAIQFKTLDAFKRVITPDNNVCLYSDFDKFEQELTKNFPNEEEGIEKLVDFIKSFGGPQWINYFRPYREKEFTDVLNAFFKEAPIKTVLSANLNDDMSAFLYILFLYRCLSKEIYLPKKLTLSEMFQIIENRILELGGSIIKNKSVDKINFDGNRVTSIVLNDGRVIQGDGIITDIDLKYVYNRLLPEDSVNQYFKNKLNSRHISASLITTFVGVEQKFDGISELGEPIVYTPTYVSKDKYSDIPDKWHIKINIKSISQPALYPKGKSAIDIRTFLPSNVMQETYSSSSYRKDENYIKEKEYLEENLINLSEHVLGNYKDRIILKRTATPYTFERYTNGDHGSAMGWAIEPIEYSNGFRIVSPISNLFHVGSWASFPGIEGVVNYCLAILPRIVRYYGKI